MKIVDPGHIYILQGNKNTDPCTLLFFKDEAINDSGHGGTTNQEVCRALIDRIKFLNNQQPCILNETMIIFLRSVIELHEMRAAEQKGIDIDVIQSWFRSLRQLGVHIETIAPRRSDGHIYPLRFREKSSKNAS